MTKAWWSYCWRFILLSILVMSIFGWILPMSLNFFDISIGRTPLFLLAHKIVEYLMFIPISYFVFKAVVPKYYAEKSLSVTSVLVITREARICQ